MNPIELIKSCGFRVFMRHAADNHCFYTDGSQVTGWKGNTLGVITRCNVTRSNFGGDLTHVRVRDIHGGMWHGKGAGRGMCINLYPMKGDAR
jgi:hypothetical protein